jgi:hypothetical protein
VAEACARFSIIKYDAGGETLAAGILEFSQSAKVGGGDRGGRLDLHARYLACTAFHHDIDFGVICRLNESFVNGCLKPFETMGI